MISQVLDPANYQFLGIFVPYFFAGILVLILGLVVLWQERISKVSAGFFFLALSIGTWCVSVSFVLISRNDPVGVWWTKHVQQLGACFVPCTGWFFLVSLLNLNRQFKWSILLGFVYSCVFYLLILSTNWIVDDTMYVYSWGRYPRFLLPNGLIALGYVACVAIGTPIVLLEAYQQARKNIARLRVRYLAVPFSLAYLAIIDYVPAFGVDIYPLGSVFLLLLIVLTAYAFRLYRFTDITPAAAVDQIVHTMNDMLIVCDRESKICFVNRAVSDILGYGYQELIDKPVLSLVQASADMQARFLRFLRGGKAHDEELVLRTRGERDVCVSLSVSPLISKFQDQEGLVIILRDIGERKQAEKALRESKQRLSDIIDFLPDATFVTDMESRVIAWNKAIEDMTGVKAEDILGKGDYEYSLPFYGRREPIMIDLVRHPNPDLEKKYANLKRDKNVLVGEVYLRGVGGRNVFVSAMAAPLYNAAGNVAGSIEVIRDINERKLAEEKIRAAYQELKAAQEQMVRSEKMAAVGQLAAGVAHEINNPLGVILGFAQILIRHNPPGSPMEMPVRSIEREALRCKNLVKDLLAFSRDTTSAKVESGLNELLQDALHLVGTQARLRSVELIRELQDDIPRISCNPVKIQQVIINLCNNALDAMPGGGKLTIKTLKAGEHLEIQVADTGRGLTKEMQSKIFEPFFTTKEEGQGTGLGLSLAYQIVRDHRGRIECESESGKGTLFRVLLPLSGG